MDIEPTLSILASNDVSSTAPKPGKKKSTAASRTRMQNVRRNMDIEKRKIQQRNNACLESTGEDISALNPNKLVKPMMKRGRKSVQATKAMEEKLRNTNFLEIYRQFEEDLSPENIEQKQRDIENEIANAETYLQRLEAETKLRDLEKQVYNMQMNAPKLLLEYHKEIAKIRTYDFMPDAMNITCILPVYEHQVFNDDGFKNDVIPDCPINEDDEFMDVEDNVEFQDDDDNNGGEDGGIMLDEERINLQLYQVVITSEMVHSIDFQFKRFFEMEGVPWTEQIAGPQTCFATNIALDKRINNQKPRVEERSTPVTKPATTSTRKRPLTRLVRCKSIIVKPQKKLSQLCFCVNPTPINVNAYQKIDLRRFKLPQSMFNLLPKKGIKRSVAYKIAGLDGECFTWVAALDKMCRSGVVATQSKNYGLIVLYYEPELTDVIKNITFGYKFSDALEDKATIFKPKFSTRCTEIMNQFLEMMSTSDCVLRMGKSNDRSISSCNPSSNIDYTAQGNFSFRAPSTTAYVAIPDKIPEKLRNFQTYLAQRQGKEPTEISEENKSKIKAKLVEWRYSQASLQYPETWKNILKSVGLQSMYKHIPKIMMEVGGVKPQWVLQEHEYQTLCKDYENFLKVFQNLKGNRHNVMTGKFMYNELCRAHGWTHLMDNDNFNRSMISSKNYNVNRTLIAKIFEKMGLSVK